MGTHIVTAAYTGDAGHATSVSGPVTVTVAQDQTPTLTGVAATASATSGGYNLTLSGQNLTGATAVNFGGTSVAELAVDPVGQFLVFSVPAGTGTVPVSVTNPAGTSNTVQFTYPTSGSGGRGVGVVSASPSGQTVAPSGGVLASSDGSFQMTVPAGAIGTGQSLSVSTSATAPSGAPDLPAGFRAASPYVTLTGATLSQPLPATIKYEASAGQTVMVFADGAWHYVPTTVGTAGTLAIYVSGPDTFVVLSGPAQFPDVPADYWGRDDIRTLMAAGIVAGFSDDTFQPDGTLTRAQFVKMLDLTLNLQASGSETNFTDVAASDWFAPYVAAAVHAGLVEGVSPTSFAPDSTVTREQMAVLVARALNLTGTAELSFNDTGRIDAWAQGGVQAAVAAGYLEGFPDGSFQPEGATTRAQAAKVLARAIAQMAPKSP